MNQSCASCSASFQVTDSDLSFYDQVSPVFNGQKYGIPPPTHCPDCRQQQRLAACNEFTLFPGTCDRCSKNMISQFVPGQRDEVWCRDCWLKDDWNPLDYGSEYDFSRSFHEQFIELRAKVPEQGLSIDGENANCEYIHYAGSCKNCYLIMHADFCEDCYYGYGFKKNTSCLDGFYNLHSELCYDCIDVHKCYALKGCQDCINCSSSAFLRDCVGCQHCFLCVGLRDAEYCIENQQLSKEEYEKRMARIDTGSYQAYRGYMLKRKDLELQHTFKEYQGHNLEQSSGDHLTNCKDCVSCFDCEDGEGLKHCYQLVLGSKDNHDIYQYGTNLQQSYHSAIIGENSYHVLFSQQVFNSSVDVYYSYFIDSCKNIFGSTQLRNQRYCILNKQYTEGEWNDLVPKIIEKMKVDDEWGQYFPVAHSQFGYNETTAHMYYPLTKEEAASRGYKWSDYAQPDPKTEKVISSEQLPDNINDIPEDVLNWGIICEVTKRPFKLTAQEFKFYKDQKIPAPRRSWLQRHFDRFHQRNPRQFFARKCNKCSKDIQTTWSPERPEKVYCEACYLGEVY